jgi:hypothetical protein
LARCATSSNPAASGSPKRSAGSILPGKKNADGSPATDGETDAATEAAAADAGDEAAQKKRSLAALREWIEHSKGRLDDWQKQVDNKVRSTLDSVQHAINPWSAVNKDVKALADRIAELEAK